MYFSMRLRISFRGIDRVMSSARRLSVLRVRIQSQKSRVRIPSWFRYMTDKPEWINHQFRPNLPWVFRLRLPTCFSNPDRSCGEALLLGTKWNANSGWVQQAQHFVEAASQG